MENIFAKKSLSVYWIWLALKLNNQNSVFQNLLDLFDDDVYGIYKADRKALSKDENLKETQIEALLDKNIDEAMTIYKFCQKNNVGILTYNDPNYPVGLKTMKKPPILLYYWGKLPQFNEKICVSIVGTRKMTEYGMRSCYKIAYELASAGAVIVSGMALGIDSVAHVGAISARGETVAILGCGIDVLYPKQHRLLRKHITQHGVIMTAYHPSTPAYKNHFPERNAIISAISEGTLVVEAPKNSGALITADCAAEQSRTVYALPGSIEEPMSDGPNNLIKNGAVAVTSAQDILEYYFEARSKRVSVVKLRQGELSSDFDASILEEYGVSANCHRIGTKETPAAMLKKLNEQLNNNEEQNSDYYSAPKMKRINNNGKVNADTKNMSADEPIQKKEIDESILSSLTETERQIFNEMPCDKPTSVDMLSRGGYDIGTLMATLTILEIKGLVSSLPGGLYIRK